MNAIWQWGKDKFGRIVTGLGFFLAGIEGLDITSVKEPLQSLIGGRGVALVTLACFGLSWARHQQIAQRVSKLEQAK